MKARTRTRQRQTKKLKPHQFEALEYGLFTDHPAFIMEMRCGKTLTLIRYAQTLGLRTCVVVAPVTVLEGWEEALDEEGERYVTAYGLTPEKRIEAIRSAYESRSRCWLLISYESAVGRRTYKSEDGRKRHHRWLDTDVLGVLDWDLVALDESPKIANPQSQVSRFFTTHFRDAKIRVLLTGLINPESDLQVFQQFKFLYGEFLGCRDYWTFRNRFFRKGTLPWQKYDWLHKPGVKKRIKSEVHRLGHFVSRRKAGIKDKIEYQTRRVDMTPAQKKLYRQIETEYAAVLKTGERVETKWKLTQRLWLQRVAGGFDPEENCISTAKAQEVVNLLKGELAGQKVLILFKFRCELELVKKLLKKARISVLSIDSEDSVAERKAKLQQFRGKVQVLEATEKILKFGVNASVCNTIIYYSNEESCEARVQSESRIIAIGKDEPLLAIDLATRNTVDEPVIELVRRKKLKGKMFSKRLDAAIIANAGRRR